MRSNFVSPSPQEKSQEKVPKFGHDVLENRWMVISFDDTVFEKFKDLQKKRILEEWSWYFGEKTTLIDKVFFFFLFAIALLERYVEHDS